MKVPQMFCLVFLLFVSVEVLGQRQKGSRDSGNNGLGIGLHQAPENVGQTAEQSGRGRNRNDGHRRENEGGRKSGGRHSERHTEHREDRRHRNREGGRHSKHDHGTTPEPVLTEKDMFQFLCNQCKQKDPNNANCPNLCQASTNTDVNKAIAGQLGNSFCSFCEYYRSYRSYYQSCRNRLCAAGKK